MSTFWVQVKVTTTDHDDDVMSIVPDVIRSRFFDTSVHVDDITVIKIIKEPS